MLLTGLLKEENSSLQTVWGNKPVQTQSERAKEQDLGAKAEQSQEDASQDQKAVSMYFPPQIPVLVFQQKAPNHVHATFPLKPCVIFIS